MIDLGSTRVRGPGNLTIDTRQLSIRSGTFKPEDVDYDRPCWSLDLAAYSQRGITHAGKAGEDQDKPPSLCW